MDTRSARRRRSAPRFDLTRFAPYLLNRVVSLINADFREALRREGLTINQWRVLASLAVADGRPIGALADATVTEQATLSRIVAQMERKALVVRRPRPGDGRFIEVHITARGRARFALVRPVAEAQAAAILATLTARERDGLVALLRKILAHIEPAPARAAVRPDPRRRDRLDGYPRGRRA